MSSRSAVVLVVLIVAIVAFCFAGVFAAMTGTYHLNLDFGNHTNDTGFFGNVTEFNSGDHSSSSSNEHVQTYSEPSSSSSTPEVETKEDTSSQPAESSSSQSTENPQPSDSSVVTTTDSG